MIGLALAGLLAVVFYALSQNGENGASASKGDDSDFDVINGIWIWKPSVAGGLWKALLSASGFGVPDASKPNSVQLTVKSAGAANAAQWAVGLNTSGGGNYGSTIIANRGLAAGPLQVLRATQDAAEIASLCSVAGGWAVYAYPDTLTKLQPGNSGTGPGNWAPPKASPNDGLDANMPDPPRTGIRALLDAAYPDPILLDAAASQCVAAGFPIAAALLAKKANLVRAHNASKSAPPKMQGQGVAKGAPPPGQNPPGKAPPPPPGKQAPAKQLPPKTNQPSPGSPGVPALWVIRQGDIPYIMAQRMSPLGGSDWRRIPSVNPGMTVQTVAGVTQLVPWVPGQTVALPDDWDVSKGGNPLATPARKAEDFIPDFLKGGTPEGPDDREHVPEGYTENGEYVSPWEAR
jgi:hypothetical protein